MYSGLSEESPSALAEFVDGGIYVGGRSSHACRRARAAMPAALRRVTTFTRFFEKRQKET